MKALKMDIEGTPYILRPKRSKRERKVIVERNPRIRDATKKGNIRKGIPVSNPCQKITNEAKQSKGCSREENKRRNVPREEVEVKTTKRKVNTAAKPKRESMIHHHLPKPRPRKNPVMMKESQRTQQNRERAAVRLRT